MYHDAPLFSTCVHTHVCAHTHTYTCRKEGKYVYFTFLLNCFPKMLSWISGVAVIGICLLFQS